MKENYSELLKDRQVKRWYDNVARGSEITADVYLRRFGAFLKRYGLTADSLLKMDSKELKNTLLDLVSDFSKEGKAGSYIESNVKAVKSWLSFNEIGVKGKIKIDGAKDTPTLREERVPTADELRKILLAGDNKQRVASGFIGLAGLRLETVGDYKGLDGLKVSDLPEMVIKDGEVSFEKIPAMVKVRNNLSKAGHAYFTFLPEEGCQYVKDYLEERIRAGEKIDKDSPIITAKSYNKKEEHPHITTSNIGDTIRFPIRKAGFSWRPYVLRSYFETQLMLGDYKGLILRDYRVFFMGHKGDMENRYSTNKGRLPVQVIEDMRTAFKKASRFLETTKNEATEEQLEQIKSDTEKMATLKGLETALSIMPIKGSPVETLYLEFKRKNRMLRELTIDEKIQILEKERDHISQEMAFLIGVGEETITSDHGKGPTANLKVNLKVDDDPQKVISESELEKYLADGWQFVSSLRWQDCNQEVALL